MLVCLHWKKKVVFFLYSQSVVSRLEINLINLLLLTLTVQNLPACSQPRAVRAVWVPPPDPHQKNRHKHTLSSKCSKTSPIQTKENCGMSFFSSRFQLSITLEGLPNPKSQRKISNIFS